MNVAILQSGYIPWIGYFSLIDQVDIFVFFDDVQWTTRDWRNRNRIRTPQGWKWLTVPVAMEKPYFEYCIKDVKIDYSQNWQNQHLSSIMHNYKKTPHYQEVFQLFENALNKKHEYIIDLNYDLIFKICDYLTIDTSKFKFSQQMGISNNIKKDDRLLAILNAIGGVNTYISGPAAKSYLEKSKFEKNDIQVLWHEYEHPYYQQQTWESSTFISHLSILDLLFNHGKSSHDILTGKHVIKVPAEINIMLLDK